MTKKENTKLIKLVFEVYRKGVEGEECNLDDSLKEILAAINYTRCCEELKCDICKEIKPNIEVFETCKCGKGDTWE
tara:strand:+ start:140 stop:367 length:228 start_codon:yes stop_codon:yes gene_type:complete